MNRIQIIKIIVLTGVIYCFTGQVNAQVNFTTKQFSFQLDAAGKVASMKSLALKKEYLVADKANALLNIRVQGKIVVPQTCAWKPKSSELFFTFPQTGMVATVKVKQETAYLTFELTHMTNADPVELVLWGPFPTSIGDTVGEVVGVVRNKEFAIGIQALNVKTLGGYPNAESDIEPSYDIFFSGNKVDVTADDMNKQLFRGDVARPTDYGSVLQAYCRNRNKERIIENWEHSSYVAPAYDDGGIIGSKIALFGVATKEVLSTIGQIELKENLPHPLIDGVWGKQNNYSTESYLIMDFGVSSLTEAMNITRQAGLRYLYHGDPFETWGHFKLKTKDFPSNWASLKECIDKAKMNNLRLGVHTLSNFITTNDPYVSPIPDPRLAKVGYAQLTESINDTVREIGITNPEFFNQFKNNTLKSAVIGNEIIRYGSVSVGAPWKLIDCQRGAFGSKASAHKRADTIGKLMDHPYKVFLTNYSLQEEMSKTLARLFNETGLMQISFDGLEGCWSSGMGQYARQLFTKTWYDNLRPELQGKVINDASNPGHYFWHIYTRMNWGEPWYAGFRESQLQLRLKNQQFFRRNLMPSMLGWFSLRAETSSEDIEWMLAMGAGYNAGFGLSTSIETLKKHGKKDEILALIKLWETARLHNVFNEEQKERMRSLRNEFHLEATNDNTYKLTPVNTSFFKHVQQMKQPGEPVFSQFPLDNKGSAQPIAFILTMTPGKETDDEVTFNDPSIGVSHQDAFVLPVNLKKNQVLYCDGTTVKLYNRQWQLLQTVNLSTKIPLVASGKNEIYFDGKYSGENGADIKIEMRLQGTPELIKR